MQISLFYLRKKYFYGFYYEKRKEYFMQQNLSINPVNTSFRANLDGRFLDAADGYYKQLKSPVKYKQFCSAVRRFAEIPNTDNITITYKKIFKDGKPSHALYAIEEGKESPVVLTVKDHFRKLLEKFSYMNEYEFKTKMGIIKK